MKLFVLDRDYYTLKKFDTVLSSLDGKSSFLFFTNTTDFIQAVKNDTPDAIIVDADSNLGIETVKKILNFEIFPKIIISSSSDKFAVDAVNLRLFEYMLKPVSEKDIKDLYSKLKHPLLSKIR
ncbi:MAG: hypothetical protein PUB34_07445 [Clostridia bacterium]|nr:hypothetical protein [Clostridia bacterium]